MNEGFRTAYAPIRHLGTYAPIRHLGIPVSCTPSEAILVHHQEVAQVQESEVQAQELLQESV